jgi:hypothetical protein
MTRTNLGDLKRDRRPMLVLLGSIAAVTITLVAIGQSIQEKTGAAVATVDGQISADERMGADPRAN